MAHPDLSTFMADLSDFRRRIFESQRAHAEALAMTRKSIEESQALMAAADAILAKR